MKQQILNDQPAAASMKEHLKFTEGVMDPINKALTMERQWCQDLQKSVAGPFASKIKSISSRNPSHIHALSPRASLNQEGTLDVELTVGSDYEGNWPVGPDSEQVSAGPFDFTAVRRNTATSVTCRVVSRTTLAALLNEPDVQEPVNVCRSQNEVALQWALDHIADRTLKRYNSAEPCNSCVKGIPAKFIDDLVTDDIDAFENMAFNYTQDEAELNVRSPSFVSEKEYSCCLLSPARAVDFLMFDAFSASRYASTFLV